MIDVHVAKGDDWSGFYVNLELKHEGHEIPVWVWAEELSGIGNLDISVLDFDDCVRYLDEHGRYPEHVYKIFAWLEENPA